MDNNNKGIETVGFLSVGVLILGVLATASIALAFQEGYRLGVKESPGTTNVAGDQIINTNGNFSPFSGNANKNGGKKNGK